eukprot:62460_1
MSVTGIILLACTVSHFVESWSFDTIPLWADFHTRSQPGYMLSDYQSEFLATNYEFLSIEKCTGYGRSTEEAYLEMAAGLNNYDATTKVLFYWNAMKCYCDCYDVTKSFYANKSMWFHDDKGNPVYMGTITRPFFDLTQQYVRDWWVDSLVSVLSNAIDHGIIVGGVFIDSLYAGGLGSTSRQRTQLYNDGILLLLIQTKQALNKLQPDLFILGNALHLQCHPYDRCANMAEMVDGICVEHFGSYEQLDTAGKYPNTYWNVQTVVSIFDFAKTYLDLNVGIFIKAWIGPEKTPINWLGPTWPNGYRSHNNLTMPNSYSEIRTAAVSMLSYPLAAFLCGIYNENVYFSYGWRWNLNDGYVPCPDHNTTCAGPTDWYPEFTNELGRPTSPVGVLYDGYKCNRTFEYAIVYVDLADEASAEIIWLTRNPTYHPTSQTTAPTDSPTILPTTEPTVDVGYGRNRSEERKSGSGLLVIQAVVLVLIVSGCVVYFCYKRTKMKINVENVNSLLIVK